MSDTQEQAALGDMEAAVLECRLSGEPMRYVFSPDFPGFAGHFPGKPVVPGYVLILAAAFLAGEDGPARLREVQSCKFTRPVGPNDEVRVEGTLHAGQNGLVRLKATLYVQEDMCAVMTLLL